MNQHMWGVLTESTYLVEARRNNEVVASFKLKPKPGKLYSYGLDEEDNWVDSELPTDAVLFRPE